MRPPNFLIIGAAKSGTTALYEYLRQHPQVYMSPLKETNFFALDGKQPRFAGPRCEILNRDSIYRYEDYIALFAGVTNEVAVGEATPRYLFTLGTAEKIRRRFPTMRIVVILRNPVERAISSFAMYKRDGLEPSASLSEAIEDEPRRIRENWAYSIHVQKGFYGQQLKEYYNCFPKEHIRVYLYEDFVSDPLTLMQKLWQFLGVNSSFVPNMSTRYNQSGIIKNRLLRFLWTNTHPLRSALPLMPKSVRKKASLFFTSRAMLKIPCPEDTRHELQATYREDILMLQDLIERDLSAWVQ